MYAKLFVCLTALCATIFIHSAESLRILGLFPHPGLSHFHFFHPIMRGLAEAGHDVTVIGHFPDKDPPPNYKDIPLTKTDILTNSVDLAMFANRPLYRHFIEFFMLHNWGMQACELALNSTAIQNQLNTKQKYDVILIEQFNSDCMMGVAWKLKAPVIGLSSCTLMPWHYDRVANPLIPSYMPALFLGHSEQMTYAERLSNWITLHGLKLMYKFITVSDNDQLTRKFIRDENMPYLGDLIQETSMIFVNSHYSLSGSRPMAPPVIELGGIHIKDAKPLDDDLKQFLDSAKDGVIYVSWGSMIRAESLPVEKRNSFLKAFGSFKQKVLWKWENATLPNQPSNVFIRKWMPQKDILCHPNVRVFVSHGGLMGSSEAAHCGVPMVLTPMYGDQFLNSRAAEYRGMGSIIHYEDITEETMKAAIKDALKPQSMENAKKVSFSYQNRPIKAIDEAIWWTEYVAATKGAPLLQSHSANLSAIIYHSIDVHATIAGVILLIASCWMFIYIKCCKRSNGKKSKSE